MNPVDRQRACERLLAGQTDQVMRPLERLQERLEDGENIEHQLQRGLSVFSAARPDLTGVVLAYQSRHPDSYLAQLAAGLHLDAVASRLRTFRLAKDIPADRLGSLEQHLQQAQQALNDALNLSPAPGLASAALLMCGMVTGDDPWRTYLDGHQRQPGSFALRVAMLRCLRAEWGGRTFIPMRDFLTRPEHASLSADQRTELQALELAYEGHHLRSFQNDAAAGTQQLRRSLALKPTGAACISLIDVEASARDAQRHFELALQLNPDNDTARSVMGAKHVLEGRSSYGWQLLLEARRWGDPYACDLLSQLVFWVAGTLRTVIRVGL